MTGSWTDFVQSRLITFREDRQRFERLHGQEAFLALETFYSVMDQLFSSGALGGLRWAARRPREQG
jgi:hypothetical protein